jgi:hypothetical protein
MQVDRQTLANIMNLYFVVVGLAGFSSESQKLGFKVKILEQVRRMGL